MKRALSIFFPHLPVEMLQRRRRAAGKAPDAAPTFLITKQAQREVIAACCQRSARLGVYPTMPVAQARSLLPGSQVRIERFNPIANAKMLRALALFAHRFSPIVAVDEPDGLLVDVTGCQRVFHGEDHLLEKVRADLARVGFTAHTAIAPTFAAAWALARFEQNASTRRHRIITDQQLKAAIASLPTPALRLEPQIISGLEEVGIERIGQLFDIPRSVLPARFGNQVLLRLDQALGNAIEMITPVRESASLRVSRSFDGPTTQVEAIHITIIELLDQLARQLLEQESGADRLTIDLERSDLPTLHLAINLSRPHRDRKHLWALLYPKIENADLGFGIERITITAPNVRRMTHEQIEHWHDASTARCDAATALHIGELTDLIISRMGHERLRRSTLIESHIPESAFSRPSTASAPSPIVATPRSPTAADRPTILFEQPIPAQVTSLVPDGPIHTLRWHHTVQSIITTIGPERLGPQWWHTLCSDRADTATRDYFQVQDETGRWLWIYRTLNFDSAQSRWFVHGLWA